MFSTTRKGLGNRGSLRFFYLFFSLVSPRCRVSHETRASQWLQFYSGCPRGGCPRQLFVSIDFTGGYFLPKQLAVRQLSFFGRSSRLSFIQETGFEQAWSFSLIVYFATRPAIFMGKKRESSDAKNRISGYSGVEWCGADFRRTMFREPPVKRANCTNGLSRQKKEVMWSVRRYPETVWSRRPRRLRMRLRLWFRRL